MSKPVIEIKDLSKAYHISHETKASPGTVTLRDAMASFVRKPMELLTGHKLKKEKFWALNGVNLEINQGDVVGIIGRNGSGKSTLLKVLSRITEPTKGRIVMRGKIASLLEVGTGFHPELTGRENIYFNGSILGMKKKEIEVKFDEIIAFSEVEKFLDTPVKFYSSGMYVRLAFAIAAHLDPDILIVDEVLAVGDAAFQKKCLGKMKDVASQGRTVLFVSHNMSSIKALCTKAAWLADGELKEVGDLETVTDHYLESTIVSKDINLAKRPRTFAVTGEAKITKVSIKNEYQKGELINSKKTMYIQFEITAKRDIKNIVLHTGVNVSGQIVLRFMSEFTNHTFNLKKGKNIITCVIEPTNLTGGLYSIDCSILYLGRESISHIDAVFDASTFVVKDYKVPNDDYYLSQREAIYFVPHTWEQSKT